MKKKIHPEFKKILLICATCQTKHIIYTVVEKIHIETCSNCHPFYTGTQNFTTIAGQVDKFNKRYNLNKKKE